MTPGSLMLRLIAALMIGGLLGLNRDLHGKPAGLRTHALVTLGATMATLAVLNLPNSDMDGHLALPIDPNALSRTLQGILTGIGFLGAGVIMRDPSGHVSGLTTAATIWVAAVLGILCGVGEWQLVGLSTLLILGILIVGAKIERTIEKIFIKKTHNEQ